MSDIRDEFRRGVLHKVEQEGFEAGTQNADSAMNPYPDTTWQYDVWEQGRQSGERIASPEPQTSSHPDGATKK